jgi:phage shock protein PspC (stress-responsive transcriptional regulator)
MGFIDFVTSPKIIWLFTLGVLLYLILRIVVPKSIEGSPLQ